MTERQELSKLMRNWKKEVGNECFNEDGVVDFDAWDSQNEGKKILFVLKETNDLKDMSLIKYLVNPGEPSKFGVMWPRIAQWYHAIQYTDRDFACLDAEETQVALKQVAVMNLKKTPGNSQAMADEILKHIEMYWTYIKQEIELIDPDIIVFCGTWWMIAEKHPEYQKLIPETHFAKTCFPEAKGKRRTLIDFWHPAAHYPSIIMYYGIQGIYRAALSNH